MALLPPALGVGEIYFHALRGSQTYITDTELLPTAGIEIKFYSTSGKFIDMVGTTYDNAPHIQLKIKLDKIGGLKSFSFDLSRIIDIPFFNEMETRIYVDGEWWYDGDRDSYPDKIEDVVFEE